MFKPTHTTKLKPLVKTFKHLALYIKERDRERERQREERDRDRERQRQG